MENSELPVYPTTPDGMLTSCPIGGGLTKREYFAGLAMQGCLTSINQSYGKPNVNEESLQDSIKRQEQFIKDVCTKSLEYADELLKQLSQC